MLAIEMRFTFHKIYSMGKATIEAEPALTLAKSIMKIKKFQRKEIQTKCGQKAKILGK